MAVSELKFQVLSRKVERLNISKVAGQKVVRMLALNGETLNHQLGFSFPVGLVRLPVWVGSSLQREVE